MRERGAQSVAPHPPTPHGGHSPPSPLPPLSLSLSHVPHTPQELKAAWDKSDEKPAIIILGVAALIALTAVNGVVSTVDKIPIFSDLMELVGLVVSGFFAYRYLAFKPDREELLRKIDAYLAKILGK